MPDLLEAEAHVHAQRDGVVGIDASHHDMLAKRRRALEERPYQQRADAAPADCVFQNATRRPCRYVTVVVAR